MNKNKEIKVVHEKKEYDHTVRVGCEVCGEAVLLDVWDLHHLGHITCPFCATVYSVWFRGDIDTVIVKRVAKWRNWDRIYTSVKGEEPVIKIHGEMHKDVKEGIV